MTEREKRKLNHLQLKGYGYKKISTLLGLPTEYVKTYCRRNEPSDSSTCLQCGVSFPVKPGRCVQFFCSDKCRMAWWNSHREQVQKKTYYTLVCAHCGKEFESYGNQNRKYCSRDCYLIARFHTPAGPNPVPDCPGDSGQTAA